MHLLAASVHLAEDIKIKSSKGFRSAGLDTLIHECSTPQMFTQLYPNLIPPHDLTVTQNAPSQHNAFVSCNNQNIRKLRQAVKGLQDAFHAQTNRYELIGRKSTCYMVFKNILK